MTDTSQHALWNGPAGEAWVDAQRLLDQMFGPLATHLLAAIAPDTRALFVVNPHNPSGTLSPGADFDRFVTAAQARTLVIVDEAYLDYREDAAALSAVRLLRQGQNVVVFRTLGKIHALAGLQVGYGLVDIVADGFDAGVRLHEFVPEDMVAVPLGPALHGMIVASPEYLRQHPAPQHPRDLLQHECIRFRFASGHLYKWQFDRDGQSLEIDVRGRLTLSEQTTIMRAVLDGFGLAYVLEDAARPHIEAGTMVAVLQDWSEPFPGFVLYYPKQRQMSSALRAFVDMLRE